MITIKIPLFTSLESMGDTRMYLLCYHHTEFHFVKNINMHLTNYLTTKKVLFISEIVDYDSPLPFPLIIPEWETPMTMLQWMPRHKKHPLLTVFYSKVNPLLYPFGTKNHSQL